MEAKLATLWPEITLFITTCLVLMAGLSDSRKVRSLCGPLAVLGVVVAGLIAWCSPETATPLPELARFGKVLVAIVGAVLILLLGGTVDRDLDAALARRGSGGGKAAARSDARRSTRAEFFAFVLFSLTGLMLCAGADDLIFLFLALELTSLPTYVMVAISTARNRSMEASVKYFFLGALGAAIFLYGFALIYGATGSTNFSTIAQILWQQSHGVSGVAGLGVMATFGLVLAILGVCFKIAAVPMHFYTPDVYQGSSASVAGFLAFVPKAAGFFAILLLCSLVGWNFLGSTVGVYESLPPAIRIMLWVIAVLTMTVGNVLAILQNSVKRILAYSSIAHSGYMLVGVIAGPGPAGALFTRNGLSAVLFYLLSYGLMTLGAFAVVASLERRSADGQLEESDHINDFRGLIQTRPLLGWTFVLSAVGLLGLPPLLGFLGKLPLFTAGIGAGEITLVVILGLNSAVAAYYYLRLAYVAFIDPPEPVGAASPIQLTPFASRRVAGALSLASVIGLAIVGGTLARYAAQGGKYRPPAPPKPALSTVHAPGF